MYSEPTISPTFVVRQKRKVIRHPLVIGGIVCALILIIGGLGALIGQISANNKPDEPQTEIRVESRMVIHPATSQVEVTEVPTIMITTPTLIQVPPLGNDDDTAPQINSVQAKCRITSTGDANVNIRSGPDLSFSLISSLNDRTTVDAIAVSDNRWFQILNTDGTIGWVGGSVVDESGDCDTLPTVKTPACAVQNTTGNRVNIRDHATTNSNVIRTLSVTDVLMADGHTEDGWYRVLLTGELGWIYKDVVALSDACKHVQVISASEPTPQPAIQSTSLVFKEGDCVIESYTGTAIDLREGPGMEFAVVAKLNKAMVASHISSNGWYQIDGSGWAFAGDLIYRGLCNLLPRVTPDEVRGSSVILVNG